MHPRHCGNSRRKTIAWGKSAFPLAAARPVLEQSAAPFIAALARLEFPLSMPCLPPVLPACRVSP